MADTSVTVNQSYPGTYEILARSKANPNDQILLLLYGIKGIGKYPLGTYSTVSGGFVQLNLPSGNGFNTPTTGAAGEVEITALSPTRIAGKFFASTGGGATPLAVTDGVFDLPLTDITHIAPNFSLDSVGGFFRGTVEGTAFTAAGATATLPSVRANRLALFAFNDAPGFPSTEVNVFIENVTGPGTYALDDAALRYLSVSMRRYLSAPSIPANSLPIASWHSQQPGSSGTVTITSLTATRIVGIVTATIAAEPGSPVTRTVDVSFTFDLGRRAQ